MAHSFDAEALGYRYVVGIDLGTTNSAVAYVDLAPESAARAIRFFQVPQLVAPGETASRSVLPSFLYLPGAYDLPAGSTALPWDAERDYAVGEFAREQGALVPGRLVASAKSWLSHAAVDRTAPILPWGARDGVPRVSPVAASMRYLQHIREAWNEQVAAREGHRFEEQLVILTVPASFDEVARELTATAAREAGIPRVVLLEEPLAAFYAWLSDHEADWQERMQDGQLILVCDVGGGTTDFSIIGIQQGESGLRFDRLAVGEHLMLGGDNMDYTLGRHVESKLVGGPGKLDAQRWHQLVHQCRKAKEQLLEAADEHAEVDITVMGTAGKLIAGTLKSSLTQEEVRQLILDGFFPDVALEDRPGDAPRRGLTELGLPYAQDPAITRHLAAFWQRYRAFLRDQMGRTDLYPDFLLFNGGALAPASVRERLTRVIRKWFQSAAGAAWAPAELSNPRPELAVAKGAAYYGLVRLGEGVRVGSGSPRAYYVGVEADPEAAARNGQTAVCLVPRGTEEGFEVRLEELDFTALTNQPVSFQVFTSSTRLGDELGEVVQLDPEEVSVLPPIRTVLRFGKGTAKQLPVQLAVRLTEVGTLELWCQSLQSDHRWQLQFDVRQEVEPASAAQVVEETVDESLIEAAQEEIRKTFRSVRREQHAPEQLRRRLEEVLDRPRAAWPVPLIRKLADTFLEVAEGRTLSARHEARWYNLLGYCLRPGFGDPVDAWRMKQAWKRYFEGVSFHRDVRCRSEWWVFWRRVAGGLTAGQQLQIYQEVRPHLQPGSGRRKSRLFPERLGNKEAMELWMALANFERLPAEAKVELGRLLLQQFEQTRPQAQELWTLSRLGARDAMYGPLDRLIPSAEAAAWLETLLALTLDPTDRVAHALVHLASYTGDRARDVPEAVRERLAQWLTRVPNGARFRDLLMNPDSALRHEEQDWVFGESLPAGLALFSTEKQA